MGAGFILFPSVLARIRGMQHTSCSRQKSGTLYAWGQHPSACILLPCTCYFHVHPMCMGTTTRHVPHILCILLPCALCMGTTTRHAPRNAWNTLYGKCTVSLALVTCLETPGAALSADDSSSGQLPANVSRQLMFAQGPGPDPCKLRLRSWQGSLRELQS